MTIIISFVLNWINCRSSDILNGIIVTEEGVGRGDVKTFNIRKWVMSHSNIKKCSGITNAATTKRAEPGHWVADWEGNVGTLRGRHVARHETRCRAHRKEKLTGACGGAPWSSLAPSPGKAAACCSSGSLRLLRRHSRRSPLRFMEEEWKCQFLFTSWYNICALHWPIK